MKIIIVGYYSTFWHEAAWAKALRELGHEVLEFKFQNYFPSNLFGRIQNRFLVGAAVRKINEDLIRLVDAENPDIVLCYRALPLTAETIQYLARARTRTVVCYNNDNAFGKMGNKAYWRLFKRSIPYYDLHLAYRDSDLAHLGREVPAYVLLPHNMPWLHRVLSESDLTDWHSDICFLGHFEPDRRKRDLDSLMRNIPATYRLHGSLWEQNSKGMAWQGMDTSELQGQDYVAALNAAKIALVFFSTWNADTFTRRVFEIPACGTMMLSQRTDKMKELYAEDKEAVYFGDAQELVDKARFYLAHDTAREQIASAGRLRCLNSGYDIYSRMQEWLAVARVVQEKKAS